MEATDERDRLLVQAAQRGDSGAFEQLVRRHTGRLYAAALRTTGSPQTAEEVVQDTWVSAWRHLPGFLGQSAVSTWLFRIATNTALNSVRRRPAHLPLDLLAEVPGGADVEGQVESRERADAVRRAVAELPMRQRDAVVLRDLEGLSYEEVAAVLGCSTGSVKSLLNRARGSLAMVLRDGPAGPGSGDRR